MGLNLSQELEARLKQRTQAERWARWQDENQAAIEDHNRRTEREGLWSDGLRQF
jgi:antitoxin CcdA